MFHATELTRCFVLSSGEELIVEYSKGHNEVALEYIKEKGYEKEMRRTGGDPIEYMITYLGAAKVGSKTEGKVVEVNVPYISKQVKKVVENYKSKGYKVRNRRIHPKW